MGAPGFAPGMVPSSSIETKIISMLAGVDSFWLYPCEMTLDGGKITIWSDHLRGRIAGHTTHNHSQSTSANRPTAVTLGNYVGAEFNLIHRLDGAGAFTSTAAHTISIVWNRTGACATSDSHIWAADNALGQAHLAPQFSTGNYGLYSGFGYNDSVVVCPIGFQTITFVVNGTDLGIYRDAVSQTGITITSLNVSASLLGNYVNVDDAYGIVGTVYSVIYSGSANPLIHEWHRQWASLFFDAPTRLYSDLLAIFGADLIGFWIGEDLVVDESNNITSWPGRIGGTFNNETAARFGVNQIGGRQFSNPGTLEAKCLSLSGGITASAIIVATGHAAVTAYESILYNYSAFLNPPMARDALTSNWHTASGWAHFCDGAASEVIPELGIHIFEADKLGETETGVKLLGAGTSAAQWPGSVSFYLRLSSIPSESQRASAVELLQDYYGI
jgi:hypothetical protein